MPNYLFIIAETCEGNVIGFDLNRTDRTDGVIIYWNHESGEIDEEWEGFAEWLDEEMELDKMVVGYGGNEKEPTI